MTCSKQPGNPDFYSTIPIFTQICSVNDTLSNGRTRMLFDDTYQTIESFASGEFKDRGSKFLAHCYPIRHEQEVKSLLEQLRKDHPKAVHWCYAFRLGLGGAAGFRANDDGEPAGTAGKPILNTLISRNLSNMLVVVVRYWGGTLLGVPGLINAYKTATEEALNQAQIVTKTVDEWYEIRFEYLYLNDVMQVMKTFSVHMEAQNFDNTCGMTISFRQTLTNQVIQRLEKIPELTLRHLGQR
jgi:uncharacterized YigZ family protein